MLTVDGLLLRFERHAARFEPPTFSVAGGEMCVIRGANGVGKTTFFDVLSGARRAASGRIVLAGKSLPVKRRCIFFPGVPTRLEMFAKRGVGRGFQVPVRFAGLNLDEHLALLPQGANVSPRLMQLMSDIGMHRNMHAFSYGQAKILGLALALGLGSQCCLLDEPLSGLHPAIATMVMDILDEHRMKGAAIVLAEHRHDPARYGAIEVTLRRV